MKADMTPQDAMRGLASANRRLTEKNDEYKKLTSDLATKTKNYNVALAQKQLSLRAGGMAATIIPKIAKGDEKVAQLELEMNIAEGVCKACLESMKDIREKIGSYRSILTWMRTEKVNGGG